MKILQINSVVNSGSTGRIVEEIGNVLMEHGHESYIAYGRGEGKSRSNLIRIGKNMDVYYHVACTRFTDRHGFASKRATLNFLKEIDKIKPDLIALHNLHGYYINIEILFNYIKKLNIPVTWTFHDCWPFTGHCTHFENINCYKWELTCYNCPKKLNYPKSFVDSSNYNYQKKKYLFSQLKNLLIITPSFWLENYVRRSFFSNSSMTIHNGIDLKVFETTGKSYDFHSNKKSLIFVANVWTSSKGFNDLFSLRKILPDEYEMLVIGVSETQRKQLPNGVKGIQRTKDQSELAQYYAKAFCFVNPTYSDNFPTTNLEALACGTPVITYNTGGSPEAIDEKTGFVVEKGNVEGILQAIQHLENMNYEEVSKACRARAEKLFDNNERFLEYLHVFENLVAHA